MKLLRFGGVFYRRYNLSRPDYLACRFPQWRPTVPELCFPGLVCGWVWQSACVAQLGIYCEASENGFLALGKETSEATLLFSPLFLPDVVVSGYGAWDCGSLLGTMRGDNTDILRMAEQKDGRHLGPQRYH